MHVELSLPRFYEFVHDLEKAKAARVDLSLRGAYTQDSASLMSSWSPPPPLGGGDTCVLKKCMYFTNKDSQTDTTLYIPDHYPDW